MTSRSSCLHFFVRRWFHMCFFFFFCFCFFFIICSMWHFMGSFTYIFLRKPRDRIMQSGQYTLWRPLPIQKLNFRGQLKSSLPMKRWRDDTFHFPGPKVQWALVTTTAFVSKDVAIKMNLLLYRILNEQIICKKVLVLLLFPHRTYVLDIC